MDVTLLLSNERYDIGDRTRLEAHFTAQSGIGADPTTVCFQIRHEDDDDHVEHTYFPTEGVVHRHPTDVVNGVDVNAGRYYVDWTWAKSGKWHYRFVGDGAVGAATEGYARVKRSKTLDE